MNERLRSIRFKVWPGAGLKSAVAAAVFAALAAGNASAATGGTAKTNPAAKSNCVDEIWEVRAVPSDKVGTNGGGDQVVVIEPSNERADEVSGTLCPKPLKRTVIQIVPKIS